MPSAGLCSERCPGRALVAQLASVGGACDSQDTILDEVRLPAPRPGDRVLIGNAGAYTTSYSGHSAFNGYPAPTVKITKTAA